MKYGLIDIDLIIEEAFPPCLLSFYVLGDFVAEIA